jgi:hypothetical protein
VIILGRAGVTVILAGDFADDPLAVAERSLGSWHNGDQRRVAIEEPGLAAQRTLLIGRPGAVQADDDSAASSTGWTRDGPLRALHRMR